MDEGSTDGVGQLLKAGGGETSLNDDPAKDSQSWSGLTSLLNIAWWRARSARCHPGI